MMKKIRPCRGALRGQAFVPGDKSISHRSVMFAALAEEPITINNFLRSADCLSTLAAMRALGAYVEEIGETQMVITGHGLRGMTAPQAPIDAGNSGTTLRLLMGLMAPQPFDVSFTGDDSLSRRPMGRVITPLRMMGADIAAADNRLPVTVHAPTAPLKGIGYESPVASAQVKSALLLAGLYADGATTVTEPYLSRDHTERILEAAGADIRRNGTSVTIQPTARLKVPAVFNVPRDISSAAYWLVAASVVPDSDVRLLGVGVNPTRTGIIDVLSAMGANITVANEHLSGGEPVADIHVRSAKLRSTSFGADIMPRLIDEIPIIAVAALFAEGTTVITGAGELRVKETDRLQAVTEEFAKIAPGKMEATEDGLIIHGVHDGDDFVPADCSTYGDHRMAMSLAVLGTAAKGVTLDDAACVNISYPNFYDTLAALTN